ADVLRIVEALLVLWLEEPGTEIIRSFVGVHLLRRDARPRPQCRSQPAPLCGELHRESVWRGKLWFYLSCERWNESGLEEGRNKPVLSVMNRFRHVVCNGLLPPTSQSITRRQSESLDEAATEILREMIEEEEEKVSLSP